MLKFCSSISGAALALSLATSVALAQGAIATADGEQSGVRIDITELKRTSGDTVMLKFTFVNETPETLSLKHDFWGDSVQDIHLIDAAGKKKYLAIKDASGNCVCSGNLNSANVESGKSWNLWARFPAPPAEVKEVSVVFPKFIPTDAPISQ